MIGERIIEVAVLPSTNDYMKEMWHKLSHGTVVVAATQTKAEEGLAVFGTLRRVVCGFQCSSNHVKC